MHSHVPDHSHAEARLLHTYVSKVLFLRCCSALGLRRLRYLAPRSLCHHAAVNKGESMHNKYPGTLAQQAILACVGDNLISQREDASYRSAFL